LDFCIHEFEVAAFRHLLVVSFQALLTPEFCAALPNASAEFAFAQPLPS
jgi:hypothetical protein